MAFPIFFVFSEMSIHSKTHLFSFLSTDLNEFCLHKKSCQDVTFMMALCLQNKIYSAKH